MHIKSMMLHKDCANFVNGTCKLYGVKVPPEGPACPNFTPRTLPAQEQPSAPPVNYSKSTTISTTPFLAFQRRRFRKRRGRRWRRID